MANALTPHYTGGLATAAQDRDCAALLAAMNATDGGLTVPRRVSVRELTIWAAPSIRGKLEDAKLSVANPLLRSIALSALDLLAKPFDTLFDTVEHGDLLDALQARGVVSSDERSALAVVATEPCSIAQQAIGRPATLKDIWESLE